MTAITAGPRLAPRRHADTAHHHPRVERSVLGGWAWACSCGGAQCRTLAKQPTWRQAMIEALNHATRIAA